MQSKPSHCNKQGVPCHTRIDALVVDAVAREILTTRVMIVRRTVVIVLTSHVLALMVCVDTAEKSSVTMLDHLQTRTVRCGVLSGFRPRLEHGKLRYSHFARERRRRNC